MADKFYFECSIKALCAGGGGGGHGWPHSATPHLLIWTPGLFGTPGTFLNSRDSLGSPGLLWDPNTYLGPGTNLGPLGFILDPLD